MIDTPVLIVGGGPVGLSLGIELAHRGQPSLLVEERTGPSKHPKATLLGSRSMELFRRWGLDGPIFDAAVPNDHPYYIIFTTRLAGQELHRRFRPVVAQLASHIGRPDERLARAEGELGAGGHQPVPNLVQGVVGPDR